MSVVARIRIAILGSRLSDHDLQKDDTKAIQIIRPAISPGGHHQSWMHINIICVLDWLKKGSAPWNGQKSIDNFKLMVLCTLKEQRPFRDASLVKI